jgi:hypothetical protein
MKHGVTRWGEGEEVKMIEVTVTSQNITIVYEQFKQDELDPREVKKLFEGEVIVNDFPIASVFVWPQLDTIIQLGDRRFRITKQNSGSNPVNLWDPSLKVNQMIGKPVIAIGFNYDILITCGIGPQAVMKNLFNHDMEKVNSIMGGKIINFTPRFQLQGGRFLYDFVTDIKNNDQLFVHVNSHLEKPTGKEIENLSDVFIDDLRTVIGMTERFVNAGCE